MRVGRAVLRFSTNSYFTHARTVWQLKYQPTSQWKRPAGCRAGRSAPCFNNLRRTSNVLEVVVYVHTVRNYVPLRIVVAAPPPRSNSLPLKKSPLHSDLLHVLLLRAILAVLYFLNFPLLLLSMSFFNLFSSLCISTYCYYPY